MDGASFSTTFFAEDANLDRGAPSSATVRSSGSVRGAGSSRGEDLSGNENDSVDLSEGAQAKPASKKKAAPKDKVVEPWLDVANLQKLKERSAKEARSSIALSH